MHPALASTNPFTTSAASVMRAVEPAAAPVTRPTPAAAAEPIHNSDGSGSPVGGNPGPRGESLQQGLATHSKPSTAHTHRGGPQGKGSDAVNVAKPETTSDRASHVSPGPLDQTNNISEIFVGARKIVWADEPPLRDEPIPLFLTQAHIQLDQELAEFIEQNLQRRA